MKVINIANKFDKHIQKPVMFFHGFMRKDILYVSAQKMTFHPILKSGECVRLCHVFWDKGSVIKNGTEGGGRDFKICRYFM